MVRISFSFLVILLLTSCNTDIKEIQNLNFATAIGVDYRDDQYHIYVQMENFNNVAKTEGGDSSEPQVWVSETVGETFIAGFFKAYEAGQERILWAHVNAIVLSESAIEKGFNNIFDGITRYHEFRLTPWVYGTQLPIEEVLSTVGFYNQTSLDTVLHNPLRIHEQNSTIRPMQLHKLVREIFEPSFTTYIPSISIDTEQWKKSLTPEPKLKIDGAFFIQNSNFKGYFPYEQIKGIRWLTEDTERSFLLIPKDNDPQFLVAVSSPKPKIEVVSEKDPFQFNVSVRAEGVVSNRITNETLPITKMEEETNKMIENEIEQLYKLGIENKIDFLNLEHNIYRNYTKDWKRLGKSLPLQEDNLREVTANVKLRHSGAFKNKIIKMENIE